MPRKPKPGIPPSWQALLYGLILLAAAMIVWEKAKPLEQERLWWLLLWFGVMLVAFYKATQNWAYVNPKPDPRDRAGEEEDGTSPPIRDVDIPGLDEMARNLEQKTDESEPENR